MANDKKVRVAIIGVGNCASALVQGVHYYQNAQSDDFVPGLMHVDLGGYHIRDPAMLQRPNPHQMTISHPVTLAIRRKKRK
jgi:myo-inositol-1-phosphate synthase